MYINIYIYSIYIYIYIYESLISFQLLIPTPSRSKTFKHREMMTKNRPEFLK